jgi:hypothetical protein
MMSDRLERRPEGNLTLSSRVRQRKSLHFACTMRDRHD